MGWSRERLIAVGKGAVEGYLLVVALWFAFSLSLGLLSLTVGLPSFEVAAGSVLFFSFHSVSNGFSFESGWTMSVIAVAAMTVGAFYRATRYVSRPI
jgi:hypothetical protein